MSAWCGMYLQKLLHAQSQMFGKPLRTTCAPQTITNIYHPFAAANVCFPINHQEPDGFFADNVRFIVPNGLSLSCGDSQDSWSVSQVCLKIHLKTHKCLWITSYCCVSHMYKTCDNSWRAVTGWNLHKSKTELGFFSGTAENAQVLTILFRY